MLKIRRVLISVSDKTGIVEFAQALGRYAVEILSTGGTAKTLKAAGIPVKDVSQVTGFPEMMDGRVKTLHPKIHGGLLALRSNPEHMQQLREQGIEPIDMVVVNLYPFAQTVARPGVTLAEAIENIDIGGPSMIRSAAKNFSSVAVIVNPAKYSQIIMEMETQQGAISPAILRALAIEAFDHTAEYDTGIHRYLQAHLAEGQPPVFPETIRFTFGKQQDLRYGENPHQKAAFYRQASAGQPGEGTVTSARQLQGKELSFNNIVDLQAALELVKDFEEPAACIIKHTNPCGMAVGQDISQAYQKAYSADPLSAYGGIVGLNRACTLAVAQQMQSLFLECIIAPGFETQALELLQTKKNLRLMECGPLNLKCAPAQAWWNMDWKRISGGLLIQEWDRGKVSATDLKVVTKRRPNAREIPDLLFAWRVCKHLKSNAILLAKDGVTLGVGPGQTNRVGAVLIALRGAGEKAREAVLASDAFFPFRDGVDEAARAGVAALIQPGGSVKDEEVIAAADEHGMAMVFTGMRHFKH